MVCVVSVEGGSLMWISDFDADFGAHLDFCGDLDFRFLVADLYARCLRKVAVRRVDLIPQVFVLTAREDHTHTDTLT